MKIIKRKSDNVVIFAAKTLEMDQHGVRGPDFICRSLNLEAHILLEINEPLPEDFSGESYSYIGDEFKITSKGLAVKEFHKNIQLGEENLKRIKKRQRALIDRWPSYIDLVEELLDQLDSSNISLQIKIDIDKIKEDNPL